MGYIMKTNLANRANYGDKRSLARIKYIVIHYTGNDGDTDENNGKYFDSVRYVSSHYFVDDDSVTQSVPDNYIAYAVGGSRYSNYKTTGGAKYYNKCYNSNSISIELCDDVKDGKVYPSKGTIENAIKLTKTLMKRYNVPADRVIRHFDVNGKSCPAYWSGTDAKNKKWKTEFHNKLVEKKVTTTTTSSAYYKKYTGTSTVLDTVLKSVGVPEKYRGSWSKRKPLATKNGIKSYTGSATQNNKLISLAKSGKLKKV